MQTTFELSDDPNNRGRIAHVVYLVEGEDAPRRVTTAPDENVSDAVCRELVRIRQVAVMRLEKVIVGKKFAYHFADGKTFVVEIL